MASLPPLGEVSVDVTTNLSKLLNGFAEANRASEAFDRSINRGINQSAQRASRSMGGLNDAASRTAISFRPATIAVDGFATSMRRAAAESAIAGRQVNSAASSIRRTLIASASTIAAAFGAREIMRMADAYTSFTNRIRAAGIEGRQLAERQQQLFEIAQRYGVELSAVGDLYGRVSQAQNDLGASTAQIMQTIEGAAAAVRVYGASTAEQNGAIRQLSQLLGNARVQMQEFNSLNDGARPILVAVAMGIERFHGSVARMRAEVMRSGMDTREFFQGMQRGLPAIIAQANQMPLTLGASFQVLNNALGRWIGQTNEAWSATQRIGGAIRALANNLDTIMPILGLIIAAIGARYVAALTAGVAATVRSVAADGISAAAKARLAAAQGIVTTATVSAIPATVAYEGALGGLTVTATATTASLSRMAIALAAIRGLAASAGGSILAAFGGAVGLAITAVVTVVYAFYSAITSASASLVAFNEHGQAAAERLAETARYGREAASAIQSVGSHAQSAAQYQREFAGATGDAARALQDQARAAREAALELQRMTMTEAMEDIHHARGRQINRASPGAPAQALVDMVSGTSAQSDAQIIREATERFEQAEREFNRLGALNLGQFASPNARTQGRDIGAEIASLQRDLVAANRVGNQTAQREILKQIRLRQRITELIQQGMSFEVANATAQAEQLRTTRQTTQRMRFTAAQADAALHAIGAQITSSARPTWIRQERPGGPSSQERLYQRYLAGRGPLAAAPGTGYHERNQARDVAKTPGMSLARIRQGIESAGGRIVELLDEGTHFHVAWAANARDQAQVAADIVRDEERYQSDLQQTQDDTLQAQADQASSASQVADFERQRINNARNRQRDEIANRLSLGQLNEAQARELNLANERLRTEQLRVIELREADRQAGERAQIASALLESQLEMMRIQSGLATTAAERRRIELSMLDVQRRLEEIEIERIIHARDSTDAERQIAEERRRQLGSLYAQRRSETMASTRGPLENYFAGLPRSVAEVREALERLAVDQLEDLNRRTAQFADNFASAFGRAAASIVALHDPLEVLQALLADLAQTFTAEFVERPITEFIRRRAAGPLAERLVGGASGPGGLDAAQINAAYQAGMLGVNNLARSAQAAAAALDGLAAGGIAPLGSEVGKATKEFSSQIPAVDKFGGALSQLMSIFGGSNDTASWISTGLSIAASAFGASGGGPKFKGKRGGGWIWGAGTGTSDSIPIRASTGEHITNARSARKFAPLLDAINADRLPGFRDGGFVGALASRLGGGSRGGLRSISFGDIVVQGEGDERSHRRTAKQYARAIGREVARVSRQGLLE